MPVPLAPFVLGAGAGYLASRLRRQQELARAVAAQSAASAIDQHAAASAAHGFDWNCPPDYPGCSPAHGDVGFGGGGRVRSRRHHGHRSAMHGNGDACPECVAFGAAAAAHSAASTPAPQRSSVVSASKPAAPGAGPVRATSLPTRPLPPVAPSAPAVLPGAAGGWGGGMTPGEAKAIGERMAWQLGAGPDAALFDPYYDGGYADGDDYALVVDTAPAFDGAPYWDESWRRREERHRYWR